MSVLIEIKDVCASFRHICAFLATAGSPGISISPSYVISSHPPNAFFNQIGLLVGRTFFIGIPGMQIVVVHPESAQACVSLVWSNSRVPNSCEFIVPFFSYSLNWCPNLVGLHVNLYNLASRLSIVSCTHSDCIIAFHALARVGMLFCVGESCFHLHRIHSLFWLNTVVCVLQVHSLLIIFGRDIIFGGDISYVSNIGCGDNSSVFISFVFVGIYSPSIIVS